MERGRGAEHPALVVESVAALQVVGDMVVIGDRRETFMTGIVVGEVGACWGRVRIIAGGAPFGLGAELA